MGLFRNNRGLMWLRDSVINPIGHGVEKAYNDLVGNTQNKENRELAEYQYQMDKEQWEREMKYNTPANQMARFKDAGLNSNLMYSQGNAGNSPASSPKYNAPQMQKATGLGSIISLISQITGLMKQKADVDKTKAETTNIETLSPYISGLKQNELNLGNQKHELIKHQASGANAAASYAWDTMRERVNQESLKTLGLEKDQDIKRNIIELGKYRNIGQQKQNTALDQQIAINESKKIFEQNKAYFSSMGIQDHDHPIVRYMAQMLNQLGMTPNFGEIGKGIKGLFGW